MHAVKSQVKYKEQNERMWTIEWCVLAVDWQCNVSASAHRSHHLGQTLGGCPGCLSIHLPPVHLSYFTAEFRLSVAVDSCFDVLLLDLLLFHQVPANGGKGEFRQLPSLEGCPLVRLHPPRLQIDFAEHPHKVPRIKNAGSSRCFQTEWLQVFRQQCLICEFFHPCFDKC